MRIGVIVSTYKSPEWLAKVLCGYERQTAGDFQMVIADDGSGQETVDVLDHFRRRGKLAIHHVWHEDRGFRKTEILNKAIRETECEYLIFVDGDCIPRADFVAEHRAKARRGCFLGGSACMLSLAVSQQITHDDICSGRAFKLSWLLARGEPQSSKLRRLAYSKPWANIVQRYSHSAFSWRGHNSSAWKIDVLRVNGFDERMTYGAEDTEFGDRLKNSGVRCISVRYTAICLHLDHTRGYVNQEALAQNLAMHEQTIREKRTWTPFGVVRDALSSETTTRRAA